MKKKNTLLIGSRTKSGTTKRRLSMSSRKLHPVIPAQAGIHATHKGIKKGIKAKSYIEFLDRFSYAEH